MVFMNKCSPRECVFSIHTSTDMRCLFGQGNCRTLPVTPYTVSALADRKRAPALFTVISPRLSGGIPFLSLSPHIKICEWGLNLMCANLKATDSHCVCFIYLLPGHRSELQNHHSGVNEKKISLSLYRLFICHSCRYPRLHPTLFGIQ